VYFWRTSVGPVDLAFTDRYGGASAAPYDELNLALEGGDDPDVCAANLELVVADFAPDLVAQPSFSMDSNVVQMRQVHGPAVDVVDDRRAGGGLPEVDGMVATDPSAVLVVRVADCLPVLLADVDAGVVGVAHAGRQGMVLGVVPQTVASMRQLGATEVTAWLGPRICGACYEVPEQMRAEVGALVPESVATTSWGTPSLDIGAGVRAQLEQLGVDVVDVAACTRESEELFSYRRDGARAGRFAGLVRRRSRA
jgi:YfiH family protein